MFIPPKYRMNQRLDLFSNLNPQMETGFGLRRAVKIAGPLYTVILFGCFCGPLAFLSIEWGRSQGDPGKPGLLWMPPRATDEQLSGGPVVSQLCDSRGWQMSPSCPQVGAILSPLEEENENRNCKE